MSDFDMFISGAAGIFVGACIVSYAQGFFGAMFEDMRAWWRS